MAYLSAKMKAFAQFHQMAMCIAHAQNTLPEGDVKKVSDFALYFLVS